MSTLTNMIDEVLSKTEVVENLEKQLENAKKDLSSTLETMKTEHSVGPFDFGALGKKLILQRDSTFFLRSPKAKK